VCQKETPMPYSKVLEAETLPTKEKILSALKQAVK
jgi:pyruvate dehydrogenase E1 component beta subunit